MKKLLLLALFLCLCLVSAKGFKPAPVLLNPLALSIVAPHGPTPNLPPEPLLSEPRLSDYVQRLLEEDLSKRVGKETMSVKFGVGSVSMKLYARPEIWSDVVDKDNRLSYKHSKLEWDYNPLVMPRSLLDIVKGVTQPFKFALQRRLEDY